MLFEQSGKIAGGNKKVFGSLSCIQINVIQMFMDVIVNFTEIGSLVFMNQNIMRRLFGDLGKDGKQTVRHGKDLRVFVVDLGESLSEKTQ